MPEKDEWESVTGLVDRCGPNPKAVIDCERCCGVSKVRGTTVFVDFEKKALIGSDLPCPNKTPTKGDGGGPTSSTSQPSVKHSRVDIAQSLKEFVLPAGRVQHEQCMAANDEVYMASLSETQRLVLQEAHTVTATAHRAKMHRMTTFLLTQAIAVTNALVQFIASCDFRGKQIKRSTIKKGSTGTDVPAVTAIKNVFSLLILIRATVERYDHLTAVNRDVWGRSKGFPSLTAKSKWFEEIANRYTPDTTQIYDTLHHADSVFVDIAPKLDANAFYVLGVHVASRNTGLLTQWIRAERKREREAAKELGWKPVDPSSPSPSTPKPVKPSPTKPATAAGAAAASATPTSGQGTTSDKGKGKGAGRKRRRTASTASAADAAIGADE